MRHKNHNKRLLNINELISCGGGVIRIRSFTLSQTQLVVIQSIAFFLLVSATNLATDSATYSEVYSCSLTFVLGFIEKFELKEIMKTEVKPKYKKAVLRNYNGDLSKRWNIEFYVWDVQQNKLVRKRYYVPASEKSKTDRNKYARERILKINQLLKKGYHIDRSKNNSNSDVVNLDDISILAGVKKALEIKSNGSLSNGTKNAYNSAINVFIEYLQDRKIEQMPLEGFKQYNCYNFLDWLKVKRKIKNAATINKYRDYLKSFWNILISRDVLKINPWVGIRKERERSSTQNIAFRNEEIAILKKTIAKRNPELWQFVQIMYYSLARPNEIRQLQVKHVLFDKMKIFIPAGNSKSGKDRYPEIHKNLLPVLKELCEGKVSGQYLFPGSVEGKCISKNRMNDKHRDILQRKKINPDCTLYSWKHTGVVKAYEGGAGIKAIQIQCGHYSILETDTYLKSLHLYSNEEFVSKMPKL